MQLGCGLNLKIRNTNFKCRIQKPKWSHEIRLNDAIKRSVHSGALGAQFKLGRNIHFIDLYRYKNFL